MAMARGVALSCNSPLIPSGCFTGYEFFLGEWGTIYDLGVVDEKNNRSGAERYRDNLHRNLRGGSSKDVSAIPFLSPSASKLLYSRCQKVQSK